MVTKEELEEKYKDKLISELKKDIEEFAEVRKMAREFKEIEEDFVNNINKSLEAIPDVLDGFRERLTKLEKPKWWRRKKKNE